MDLLPALFDDIERDPADATPWLVMADWLEDEGQGDRAELVRLSVQLRQRDGGSTDAEKRVRALVAAGHTVPLPKKKIGPGIEMALVPPGWFRMGSPPEEPRRDHDEGPVRDVHLTRGFWLGVYQVSQSQWEAVLGEEGPGRFKGEGRPVEGVSWDECQRFLAALGENCRLPTEAEWEYACRGLTTTAFAFGHDLDGAAANFDGNYPYGPVGPGPWLQCTAPAGSYPPNAWGLHEMHGNVWEWCSDWYAEDWYARGPVEDPIGPPTGARKVLRGGSWYSYSWACRSAGRERFSPESGAGNYGLRVAAPVTR